MADVVCVSFRGGGGRLYYFDPGEFDLRVGDHVIAETARGLEFGRVATQRRSVPDDQIPQPLKPIIRRATPEDFERDIENRSREEEARQICVEKIEQHGLPMRLVDVAYTFDGARIVFYFSAEGRVDFRSLVRDLASTFHTRIELHQIGVRDQARLLGGYGPCGRPLCCATFISEFQPVAIKMAKEQGLSLNPTKISGVCGRLMCCLRYEYDTYVDLRKTLPSLKTEIQTPLGPARVEGVDVLRGLVYAVYPDGEGQWYEAAEVEWPGSRRELRTPRAPEARSRRTPTPAVHLAELLDWSDGKPAEVAPPEEAEAEVEQVVVATPDGQAAEAPSPPGGPVAQADRSDSRRRRPRRRRSRGRRRANS